MQWADENDVYALLPSEFCYIILSIVMNKMKCFSKIDRYEIKKIIIIQ